MDSRHLAHGLRIERNNRHASRRPLRRRPACAKEHRWSAARGDQAASAIGTASSEPGMFPAQSALRESSSLILKPAYDPAGRVHTFCHAIPNAWHVMGVTQGAGLSLQWFRNRFAPGTDYDDLTAEAALSPAGAQGLFWLPYLMGERTPHLDALRARRLGGLDGQASARGSGPFRARRRLLQPEGRSGNRGVARRAPGTGAPLGRRCEESLLASAVRRHFRPARRRRWKRRKARPTARLCWRLPAPANMPAWPKSAAPQFAKFRRRSHGPMRRILTVGATRSTRRCTRRCEISFRSHRPA